jgi:hypothetical protein
VCAVRTALNRSRDGDRIFTRWISNPRNLGHLQAVVFDTFGYHGIDEIEAIVNSLVNELPDREPGLWPAKVLGEVSDPDPFGARYIFEEDTGLSELRIKVGGDLRGHPATVAGDHSRRDSYDLGRSGPSVEGHQDSRGPGLGLTRAEPVTPRPVAAEGGHGPVRPSSSGELSAVQLAN